MDMVVDTCSTKPAKVYNPRTLLTVFPFRFFFTRNTSFCLQEDVSSSVLKYRYTHKQVPYETVFRLIIPQDTVLFRGILSSFLLVIYLLNNGRINGRHVESNIHCSWSNRLFYFWCLESFSLKIENKQTYGWVKLQHLSMNQIAWQLKQAYLWCTYVSWNE